MEQSINDLFKNFELKRNLINDINKDLFDYYYYYLLHLKYAFHLQKMNKIQESKKENERANEYYKKLINYLTPDQKSLNDNIKKTITILFQDGYVLFIRQLNQMTNKYRDKTIKCFQSIDRHDLLSQHFSIYYEHRTILDRYVQVDQIYSRIQIYINLLVSNQTLVSTVQNELKGILNHLSKIQHELCMKFAQYIYSQKDQNSFAQILFTNTLFSGYHINLRFKQWTQIFNSIDNNERLFIRLNTKIKQEKWKKIQSLEQMNPQYHREQSETVQKIVEELGKIRDNPINGTDLIYFNDTIRNDDDKQTFCVYQLEYQLREFQLNFSETGRIDRLDQLLIRADQEFSHFQNILKQKDKFISNFSMIQGKMNMDFVNIGLIQSGNLLLSLFPSFGIKQFGLCLHRASIISPTFSLLLIFGPDLFKYTNSKFYEILNKAFQYYQQHNYKDFIKELQIDIESTSPIINQINSSLLEKIDLLLNSIAYLLIMIAEALLYINFAQFYDTANVIFQEICSIQLSPNQNEIIRYLTEEFQFIASIDYIIIHILRNDLETLNEQILNRFQTPLSNKYYLFYHSTEYIYQTWYHYLEKMELIEKSSIDADSIYDNEELSVIPIENVKQIILYCGIILKIEKLVLINDNNNKDCNVLNDLFNDKLIFNREELQTKATQFNLNEDIKQWINDNTRSLFEFKYLDYLSQLCQINFKLCLKKDNFLIRESEFREIPEDKVRPSTDTIIYCILQKENTSKIVGICITSNSYLNFLYNQPNSIENINTCKFLANHYYKEAEYYENMHHRLMALPQWQEAYKYYEKIIKKNEKQLNLEELIYYYKCLIMLNKYEKVIKKLRLRSKVESSLPSQLWYLLAVAQRKYKMYTPKEAKHYREYKEATQNLFMATHSNIDNPHPDAEREQTIIQNVKREQTIIRNVKQKRIQPDNFTTTHTINKDSPSYNILSIDGGGIRGLIPAIWLRELERETKKTCASLFDMMAGTSTGAIIAAGLSVPDPKNLNRPWHSASKIVDLYRKHAKEIFIPSPWWGYFNREVLKSPKYSSQGRRDLFDEYFKNTLVSQCLTDIIIPAVRADHPNTDLFTKSNCLKDFRKIQLKDVLMCTTAAPTYFKPHILDGRSYIDGGVQMNNPTMAAYTEAKTYTDKNIFILSLGTGDFVPDPLDPNAPRHLFFWKNNKDTTLRVILDGSQTNIDYQMNMLTGLDNYYRWQIWLDHPIALDEYDTETIEKLSDLAYEYLEEIKEYDNHNRWGSLIERLQKE